jgi:hypothetical protein
MNTAILFDTMSIQQYVFGSNKLKDNLGASYIVEHIFDFFRDNPAIEVGYIGGGNALIFTTTEARAKEIVKEYTTNLLYSFPGVSLAVAIKEDFKKDKENYPSEIKKLFGILKENKGKYFSINTITSHGITDICRYSSLSVESVAKRYNEESYELISSATLTKRNQKEKIEKEAKELLDLARLSKYTFTDDIDQLGLKKGEDSHIAVVHIDGNGFGKTFISLQSVEETEKLSTEVKNAVKESFISILQEYDKNKEQFVNILDQSKPKTLPIRPIILGGDDVTFVCHGKLGIWFAEKFLEKFKTHYINVKEPYSSCAGVAIVKAKYPFYRAYELAEELCNNAKKMNKVNGGNWIDFQLAYSGLGNTLEEVRMLQYDVEGFSRPYCIGDNFNHLKTDTAKLKETLPNSKIKDLREMLTRDKPSLKDFREHLMHQHPEFKKEFNDDNLKYPFFDMIELLELYPVNLLNDK